MGNCQAGDAAAAVIQHPDGRLETACWPLSASHVMAANPGHYVAVIITVNSDEGRGKPVRYLKLLRPDDALLARHFYRLVSFEDVLREFGSKRRVRLSKLLAKKKEEMRKRRDGANPSSSSLVSSGEEEIQEEVHGLGSDSESSGAKSNSIRVSRNGQWRPTLQTIAESGSFKQSTSSA